MDAQSLKAEDQVATKETIVRHAIQVGKKLRTDGYELVGIRLDSGDLAYLSIEARKLLDEEGFPDAAIVASNDLDEHLIASLKDQGARISVWGVGTKLSTAYDQPALGGVYKLSAIRAPDGEWQYKVKLSEQAIKVSNPGILQIRRNIVDGVAQADMIYDINTDADTPCAMIDPMDPTRRRDLVPQETDVDLLVPVFNQGQSCYDLPTVDEIRSRRAKQLDLFHPGVKRFDNPHQYPVGLEQTLNERKTAIILKSRGHKSE